jgi:murein DD-endopeptidase MepM/ murein hydrolase activator NlpD
MRKFLISFALICSIMACNFPTTQLESDQAVPTLIQNLDSTPVGAAVPPPTLPPTRDPNEPIVSPTPDSPHGQPTLRSEAAEYTVQPNDILSSIADRFGVTVEELVAANQLINPDQLEVGQVLIIPAQAPESLGPNFKIVPDSELVNGPFALYFDVGDFVDKQPGYLRQHREEVDLEFLTGAQIIQRVATEYSVNPKLLLALLEYQSGWLSDANPKTSSLDFPMGQADAWRQGLYRQLSWAADNLNKGYYDWKAGLALGWRTADGAFVPADPSINAGTAGVQYLLAKLYPLDQWRQIVGQDGFVATYTRLFGYPFDFAIDPLVPAGIGQPSMQLPFEPGVPWVFSGGPHGGWGDGSAWAALDFAPRGEMLGCNESTDWDVAVADGLIVRSENGAVVEDLDGDGYEQTGWTVLYMHVSQNGRVQVGQTVHAGDRIGHPSCEGGVATATHLHIARRYNGEWIPASGALPFVMDGWVSVSEGIIYDGQLEKDGQSVEACECRDPANMLQR